MYSLHTWYFAWAILPQISRGGKKSEGNLLSTKAFLSKRKSIWTFNRQISIIHSLAGANKENVDRNKFTLTKSLWVSEKKPERKTVQIFEAKDKKRDFHKYLLCHNCHHWVSCRYMKILLQLEMEEMKNIYPDTLSFFPLRKYYEDDHIIKCTIT